MALLPLGLISQGGGANGGGAFELISTQFIGGTSPTSVTFSSIVGTYTHLQLRITSRWNAGGSSNPVQIRFNGDTATNYYYHALFGNGSSVTSNSSSATYIQTGEAPPSGVVANSFGGQIIDILDYTNTNKNKTVRSLFGQHNDFSTHVGLRSGGWFSTAAITSITIFGNQTGSYFLSGSRLSLYGIKGS